MRPQIVIFVAIIIASLLTVLISYQAATSAANTVTGLTLQDIRSNAEIEASDLSNILANKIDSVATNLQVISVSDEVQKQDLNKTAIILDEGQKSTTNLTSYYMWIDRDGKLLLISNLDAAGMQKYRGMDLSQREYFIRSKETLEHYFSKVVDSINGRPRVYLSYPILSPKAAVSGGGSGGIDVGRFKGTIVAAVDLQDLGAFLQSQIPAKYKSSVILMDRGGVILYAQNVTLIGKSISGPEFQSQLIPAGRQFQDSFNSFLAESQRGQAGSRDFSENGISFTVSYQRVSVQQKDFGVLHVLLSHNDNSYNAALNPAALITQQRTMSTLLIAAVGGVAIAAAYLVLSWNKRLEATVREKTTELDNANRTLADSNRQLVDANENLEKANEQLKAHDRMKTEFINIAAHELRTPIQPILGVTEILKSRLHEGRSGNLEITDKQLAMMDRNARRLQRLSSEILDATRIEAGTLKLDKEVIDINTEAKNVIADVTTLIPEDRYVHIYFKSSVDESGNPSPLLVSADKLRIFEVISNLIRNAITFSSTGRKDGIITITTEKIGGGVDDEQGREVEGRGEVRVSITDQGTGIATDVLPRLFTRFTADRERGGTGLGLYIAKNIIEAHGGRIWAENNADGIGATFRFTLPCA